jgi:hypothetical protein
MYFLSFCIHFHKLFLSSAFTFKKKLTVAAPSSMVDTPERNTVKPGVEDPRCPRDFRKKKVRNFLTLVSSLFLRMYRFPIEQFSRVRSAHSSHVFVRGIRQASHSVLSSQLLVNLSDYFAHTHQTQPHTTTHKNTQQHTKTHNTQQ